MNNLAKTEKDLDRVQKIVYDKCFFKIEQLIFEEESQAYQACRFEFNSARIICRSAKITPKKTGLFVTFWKRNAEGVTEPFHEKDSFDFYVVNVKKGQRFGQFVIPKTELIKNGIISSRLKEGKRGFRVYPPWDLPKSKQALKTQNWQRNYFLEINDSTDLDGVQKLYFND